MKDAKLILEDGTVFQGKSFGYEADAVGEVVFNTAMTGYPESLTDPSYAGQILVMTYPLVGNYGAPSNLPEGRLPSLESERIHVKALVVADYSEAYSHWNAKESLGSWLQREHIPGITGIDTRRLTKLLRERGVMRGRIVINEELRVKNEEFSNALEEHEEYGSINWVEQVSCKEVITYKPGGMQLSNCKSSNCQIRVVLVDCGVKANIIRCLLRRGVEVIRVPWDYDFNQLDFDGLFLANGPGDPEQCEVTVKHIRTFLRNEELRVKSEELAGAQLSSDSEALPLTGERGEGLSRRSFLIGAALAGTTAAFAQVKTKMDGGLAEIEDKVAPERKTPLTPPGSLSARHFQQYCTGCQLCVAQCPNQVLRPSTGLLTLMQPTMSYERGYCRPECTRCIDVCPTDAIRPIKAEEKSSIQIGHAVWVKKNCVVITDGVECGHCARMCPVGAITMVNLDPEDELSPKVPAVNESRCIGCGACENLCPARPFSAIYVEGHEAHKFV